MSDCGNSDASGVWRALHRVVLGLSGILVRDPCLSWGVRAERGLFPMAPPPPLTLSFSLLSQWPRGAGVAF